MIISAPPFHVNQELWGELRCGPGAACQRGHPMTDSEIGPLNTSGVEPSRQAQSQQGDRESGLCPQAHHRRDPRQLTPPVGFLHLPVDQACRHLPLTPSPTHLKSLPKMGREAHKRTHSSHHP
jgi:hypothetical protein